MERLLTPARASLSASVHRKRYSTLFQAANFMHWLVEFAKDKHSLEYQKFNSVIESISDPTHVKKSKTNKKSVIFSTRIADRQTLIHRFASPLRSWMTEPA